MNDKEIKQMKRALLIGRIKGAQMFLEEAMNMLRIANIPHHAIQSYTLELNEVTKELEQKDDKL